MSIGKRVGARLAVSSVRTSVKQVLACSVGASNWTCSVASAEMGSAPLLILNPGRVGRFSLLFSMTFQSWKYKSFNLVILVVVGFFFQFFMLCL